MHTKDMLANELMKLGLMDMSLKARGGYYHDFLSPLATPEIQLCEDLLAAARVTGTNTDGINQLRHRVIVGEFDASKEESDAWAASPEGQETFNQLIRKD
jgi:hypothetical protein